MNVAASFQSPDVVSRRKGTEAREVAQLVRCLPWRPEDLGLDPSTNLRAGAGRQKQADVWSSLASLLGVMRDLASQNKEGSD